MDTRILISGPPCAGKSTLARHLASSIGGQVIDFDDIAHELGSESHHDHPDEVRRATRAEVERRIATLEGPAVVIRSAPTLSERRQVAEAISATKVIVLDVEAEEAKRRATRDRRPDWTAAAIDRWWSRYEPDPQADRDGQPQPPGGAAAMADDPTTDDQPDPKPDLGDAGKKALDEERKARRDAEKALRDVQAELKKLQDKDKDEVDRLRDEVEELKKERDERESAVLRAEVAMAKGLTAAQAKRLVGTTKEELEADADEILEAFPAKGATPPPSDKPTPDLKGGSDPNEAPVETSPAKLAESVPRY